MLITNITVRNIYRNYYYDYYYFMKWSRKGRHFVIMGDKYSQTPCGDFWTDSGTHFCRWRNDSHHVNINGPENRLFVVRTIQKNVPRHDVNFDGTMSSPSFIWIPFLKKHDIPINTILRIIRSIQDSVFSIQNAVLSSVLSTEYWTLSIAYWLST